MCPLGSLEKEFHKLNEAEQHLSKRKTGPIGASFIEEIEILDEQREKWDDDPLALILGACGSPHSRFQRRSVATKVGRRIHLMFQDGKLGRLYFMPLEK